MAGWSWSTAISMAPTRGCLPAWNSKRARFDGRNAEPARDPSPMPKDISYYRNEGGPVILADASPSQYVERGRFDQPVRSERMAWPHPLIANGKLYIRDQDVLLCYDVKRP